jgi:hypothetical protein
VNSATGLPVGNFEQVHASASYTSGTPRVIVDPALKRAYAVEEMNMGGGLVFQIQSFDLAHFNQLSTFVIPNPSGYPENFIRWGSSGLALITKTTVGLGAGKLYLIDGAFVNASGPADTTSGTTIAPVPTLSAVTPLNTTAGSSGVQITVTGWDFTGQSTLYWNGTALATNAVSTTEVQATLPASDLQSSTLASLTASNTAGQISNSLPFAVNPAPTSGNAIAVYNTGGNDLVWNNTAGKIYVSMPGIQGDLGNGIAIVDPVRGNVTTTNFLGSDPSQLSLSSDGQSLYVGFNGNNTVQQFTLPGFTQSQSWNLGADTFSGPFYALDLQADPWSPGTTAITKAAFNISPQSKGIFIYDNSIARPNSTTTFGGVFYTPQWAGGGSVIYALDQYGYNFLNLAVDSSGLSLSHSYGPTTGGNLHYDEGTNLVYTDGGEVINPSSGAIVGNFGASGIAVPDSALNRVFILGQLPSQSGTPDYTIQSFDQTGFTAVGSITIPNVVGRPTALILWGTNGLAFTTRFGAPYDYSPIGPGQLYVISGTFVNAAQSAVSTTSKAPTVMVQRTWGLAPRSAAHTVHK